LQLFLLNIFYPLVNSSNFSSHHTEYGTKH
jgi:hypothetical protein